jgi:ABC-2 type transport system permease protein
VTESVLGTQTQTQTQPRWLRTVRVFAGALKADLIERRRDWRGVLVLVLGMSIALVAALLTSLEVKTRMADRVLASEVEQQRWLNQGKKNAHSAAHYGVYVFKPVSRLSAIDPGIERFVGSTVWLEAHKQNEFANRPANDQPSIARQFPLTPALVLQVLAPLAMIFLGFGLFAAERERGSLRTLRMTGAPLWVIGAARVTTLCVSALVLAVPAMVGVVALSWLSSSSSSPQGVSPFIDTSARTAWFAASYIVYLVVWALVIATVSAWARTTRAALTILLVIWAVWTLILPRAAVELAGAIQPLPSAQSFRENLQTALGEPHDPEVEARYKAEILAEYKVKDVKELPVNWTGIMLARGEARGDRIFDQQYGALFETMLQQSRIIANVGWLSPTVAVSSISAAAAGSDTAHHLRFTTGTETHRRLIQQTMNDFIIANPDQAGQRIDGDARLWRTVPAFEYQYPRLSTFASTFGVHVSFLQLIALFAMVALVYAWRCRCLAREAFV